MWTSELKNDRLALFPCTLLNLVCIWYCHHDFKSVFVTGKLVGSKSSLLCVGVTKKREYGRILENEINYWTRNRIDFHYIFMIRSEINWKERKKIIESLINNVCISALAMLKMLLSNQKLKERTSTIKWLKKATPTTKTNWNSMPNGIHGTYNERWLQQREERDR